MIKMFFTLRKTLFYELFAERFEELLLCIFRSVVVGEAGNFSAWLCKAEYRALIQDLIIPIINIKQLVTINRQSTFQ